jgi:hypothetical protein
LQHVAQIVLGHIRTDHFVERLTVAQRRLHSLLERVIDQPLAAQHQKGAVPEFVIGSPFQNSDRAFVRHEQSQSLARSVPIDQEHQARSETLQETGKCRAVLCIVSPLRDVKQITSGKRRSLPRLQLTPLYPRPL